MIEDPNQPHGSLRSMRNLHLGCLEQAVPGWENTDITPHIFIAKVPGAARALRMLNLMSAERFEQHRRRIFDQVRYLDATRRFPFPDATFDHVYSSHMLEHLYRQDAERCVREANRVLKPGGIFRVVVPDLDALVRRYDHTQPEPFLDGIYENTQKRDKNRHHWMYTSVSLGRLLRSAGFAEVEPRAYREGQCPDLERLDSRPDESIFMEARKSERRQHSL